MVKRVLIVLCIVALFVGVAMALAPSRGEIYEGVGTSTITRTFQYPIKWLYVDAFTQDVKVLLSPSYAQDDTFTVLADTREPFDGGYDQIWGFTVLRPVAGAVKIRWE